MAKTLIVNQDGVPAAIGLLVNRLVDLWVLESKRMAPVDTGFLKDNITKLSAGPVGGKMESAADYADAVEFGTHKQSAQPHIRPGLEIAVVRMRGEL